MPTYVPPKKNTEFIFYLSLISRASPSTFQASPTLAAGDVKVATDDGAPANISTLPVVDGDFVKRIKVVVSASEMNGDNVSIIFSDAAGDEWCDLQVGIQTSTKQIDDLSTQVSVDAIDDSIDTEITAIKAKTDQLTFTVPNQADVNVQYINDAELTGNGTPATPWGPA